MRSKFEYIRPESLEHALDFLAIHGMETSVLAGGTDLTIAIRSDRLTSRYVLDVSRLEEMRTIGRDNNRLEIGAAVPFSEIIDSREVRESTPVLVKACRCIGSVQIRNAGTLGGNVVNASPAADGVPPLLTHNAEAVTASRESVRTVPVEELIAGPYRTNLAGGELIVKFILEPVGAEYKAAFRRIARRAALSTARINAAAVGRVDSAGNTADLRLSVGSITPTPCRMRSAEKLLIGREPKPDLYREAAEMVSAEMIRRTGIRHSTEYKKPAVEGIVTETLAELFQDGHA